jgi:hypothetical protein
MIAWMLGTAPVRAEEPVLMVTIDDFAQAGRDRASNEARYAALTGTMELYADIASDTTGYPERLTAKGKVNLIRAKVIKEMGIVARAFYRSGGCIPNPGPEAYASRYAELSEAYFKDKLGRNFREQIEARVQRELRAVAVPKP